LKIERHEVIAGQKIKTVRDMLREMGGYSVNVEFVVEYLQKQWWRDYIDELAKQGRIPPDVRPGLRRRWREHLDSKVIRRDIRVKKRPNYKANAKALIRALLDDGFIETPEERESAYYQCTIKGNALRMADFVSRTNRAKADALLSGALKRVAEINERPDLLHWVTEVRVFGSYLTDSNDLGDIDLAIRVEPRVMSDTAWSKAFRKLVKNSGKNFSTYIEQTMYPHLLVWRLIKNRSRHISLHNTDELDKNPSFGGKTIYTFTPPKSTTA
jgi:hypothetical protein